MSRKLKKEYYLFLVVIAVGFFLSRAYGLNSLIEDQTLHLKNRGYRQSHNTLLLLIIDFESFMCPSCLDSFLEFYHALKPPFPPLDEGILWGVLVFDEPEENEGVPAIKITEKKLRGFIMANDIKFPIMIDRFHIFKGLAKEGTAVIFFDRERKIIKKYVFPLRSKQIKEIINHIKSDR